MQSVASRYLSTATFGVKAVFEHAKLMQVACQKANFATSKPVSSITEEEPLITRTGTKIGDGGLEHVLFQGIKTNELKRVLQTVLQRGPHQPEYLDAVKEVAVSLQPVFERRPDLLPVFEQICEPERQIIFRVPWLDDKNKLQINRGFRVQHSSAIGPYKGGLRFHPSVNLSIIKMLAFEQCFKNALTGLPMGAGKGGSDFDPKGRSDFEIMRFCQSFMTELQKHIADDVDVPAGDIGVGAREIGYLFGQYKRLSGQFHGALTGKGLGFGGSLGRPEATGYGAVMFAQNLLADQETGKNTSLEGARCAVSGAGNVAGFCALKLISLGATVVSLSDSKGTVVEQSGFAKEQVIDIQNIKLGISGDLTQYKSPTAKYFGNRTKPWQLQEIGNIDLAFPSATQNELDVEDVEALSAKGCWAILEGANMPVTAAAVERAQKLKMIHVPGKMANAGGVAVSGLEMAQNRMMVAWDEDKVLDKLEVIMRNLYQTSKKAAEEYGVDLGSGGNIAAFMKVADAVKAQGAV